jgi:hypothetical protein
MQRKNFFKALATLIASPSIISEIDWDKKPNRTYSNGKIDVDKFKEAIELYKNPPQRFTTLVFNGNRMVLTNPEK